MIWELDTKRIEVNMFPRVFLQSDKDVYKGDKKRFLILRTKEHGSK
ncbi:hypothetical protein CL639_002075 [bacterium]|nr:hypothetical protein [bacterium]